MTSTSQNKIFLLESLEEWEKLLTQNKGEKMKGIIRPTSKFARCPKCKKKFQEFPRLGFLCPDCKTAPSRFYIDIHWRGKRSGICTDEKGSPLDTYQRALNLNFKVQWEIDNHTFDPDKYRKAKRDTYWATKLLDKFLYHKIKSIVPAYVTGYKKMVSRAKVFFGDKDVREIRKFDLIKFKEWLEEQKKRNGDTLGDKTVKNNLDNFKTFLRWLKDDLEILQSVPSFPKVDVQEYNWNWISEEDQVKILKEVEDIHKPFFTFSMLHGIRPGESRALKVKHVNLERESLLINSTFSGKFIREKRKGRGAKAVEIPIHPEMLNYFVDRVRNNLPEAFIFVHARTGRPYTASRIGKIWSKVRKKLNMPKTIRFYDITRHSVASQLADKNVSSFLIKNLLGHSTITTTEKYMHKNINGMRTAISLLSLADRKQIVNKNNAKD